MGSHILCYSCHNGLVPSVYQDFGFTGDHTD